MLAARRHDHGSGMLDRPVSKAEVEQPTLLGRRLDRDDAAAARLDRARVRRRRAQHVDHRRGLARRGIQPALAFLPPNQPDVLEEAQDGVLVGIAGEPLRLQTRGAIVGQRAKRASDKIGIAVKGRVNAAV